ncbi:MAG: aspartate ammonia-lyase [Microscillaceae bacterium]|nr:aspartate ammonia-lyase [Microscillaceae bacterium]
MRYESDSLGSLPIPEDAYYGVHTERGRQNFAVSGITLGHFPQFIAGMVMIKKAAALANAEIGALPTATARAICQAADDVLEGKIKPNQFPVDIIQGGGCVSTHMNINEVLANRANEIITGEKGYEFIHPNNHVNMGQSTNDVMPTALKITLHFYILNLINSLNTLDNVLDEKVEEFKDIVKLSRTCLQDAVPITLGQEFSAYQTLIKRSIQKLENQADACLDIPLGATAVGTGLGSRMGYVNAVYPHLRKVTGLTVRKDPNFFDGLQNGDFFIELSATLKAIATGLSKMATDLRILSSGNRTGMKEIILPAVQAGSSIMPGKINPSFPELINQVAYQVCGNDATVTMAVEGIELDLNIWDSIIAKCLFESCELMTRSIPLFANKCVRGIIANREECLHQAENTLSLAVVISMVFGYDVGVKTAKYAHQHNLSIKQAAIDLDILTPELAEELLDPHMLTDASRSVEIINRMAEKQKEKVDKVIQTIPLDTRENIFEVMLKMTLADQKLSQEEEIVMKIIAEALQLGDKVAEISLNSGEQVYLNDLALMNERDRELTYICAAWVSEIDDDIAGEEIALLEEIRTQLNIDKRRAGFLKKKVHQIHKDDSSLVPQWEESPWWEEFERLLVKAISLVKQS